MECFSIKLRLLSIEFQLNRVICIHGVIARGASLDMEKRSKNIDQGLLMLYRG
jgi:hypothetical protein